MGGKGQREGLRRWEVRGQGGTEEVGGEGQRRGEVRDRGGGR